MTDQELEVLLLERCKQPDLKEIAFEALEKILLENSNDIDFLGGFKPSEIKTLFDRFEYQFERRHSGPVIKTRVGLYVENQHWMDDSEPIGYYELETSLSGEILDDWFVIEKEKYLKDVEIISFFQNMNEKLPMEYLRRNCVQYEFVTSVSMIGTLFISKQFEGTGYFVKEAYRYLETADLDPDYLKKAIRFLEMISNYLTVHDLVSEYLKQELAGKRDNS